MACVSHGAEVKFVIWYYSGKLREQNISTVTFILARPGPSQRAVCKVIARETENSGATNINTHSVILLHKNPVQISYCKIPNH